MTYIETVETTGEEIISWRDWRAAPSFGKRNGTIAFEAVKGARESLQDLLRLNS